jgi:signal transduction histidine kinase
MEDGKQDSYEQRLRAAEGRAREASAQAERAANRSAFMAEASSLLSASLDFETTIRSLARLAVARIADWCLIYLLEPTGEIRRIEMAHADPRKEHLARELRLYPFDPKRPSPVLDVIQSGQSKLLEALGQDFLEAQAKDAEHAELLEQIGASSAVIAPLVARGHTLGAVAFLTAESDRRYDEADLTFAEELARRAALAMDNATLYQEAQDAARTKSDFLAVMSHELRTPLNAIMGYTDLLLMGVPEELAAKPRRQVERIGASARHLLHLIEEILAFSRMQAGENELGLELVELDYLVHDVTTGIAPLAESKGLVFSTEAEQGLVMETDPGKLRQILVNVLNNAVKFTHEGQVRLVVRAEKDEVHFEVEDTGPGIAEEHRERIFEPFWQVEAASTRRVGGTGLGLSIARRFARLLGGELSVQSAPGSGSVFTLRVPRTRTPRPGERGGAVPEPSTLAGAGEGGED